MECITTSIMDVLWNGSSTSVLKPSKGICQGDPISLYIFVLCVEKLSCIILEEVNLGSWRPIKSGRDGLLTSHLLFANDILLFGNASVEKIKCIVDCLD